MELMIDTSEIKLLQALTILQKEPDFMLDLNIYIYLVENNYAKTTINIIPPSCNLTFIPSEPKH